MSVLDDLDSRPGSSTSLLRTIVGLYLRELGGWIPVADLVALMEALGFTDRQARTAITRLKSKGIVVSEVRGGVIGYELNPDARHMLATGDRRICAPRQMAADDPWCLISFPLPSRAQSEEQRAARELLRRLLGFIGCGTVEPALWICPDSLAGEVEEIVADLGLGAHVILFRTERPRVAGSLGDAVSLWWDLDALARLHRGFIAEMTAVVPASPGTAAEAFSRYVRGIDIWRVIPYSDPGLPAELLPADWPGTESARLFAALSDRDADAAACFVRDLVGS